MKEFQVILYMSNNVDIYDFKIKTTNEYNLVRRIENAPFVDVGTKEKTNLINMRFVSKVEIIEVKQNA